MTKEKLTEKFLRLLYPERCLVCDRVVAGKRKITTQRGKSTQISICDHCLAGLELIDEPVCSVCGRPLKDEGLLCEDCVGRRHEFISGKCAISYECIARSIYRFKYNNRPSMAGDYAGVIYLLWQEWLEYIKPDAFIPVPLHKKRLKKRGYNQAAELSKALSALSQTVTCENCIIRSKNTVPQKVFDRKHRQINVKKAFIVPENDVKLKTVVVVDDIFTTGSTIDAVARELKLHGVNEVYFITISAAGT